MDWLADGGKYYAQDEEHQFCLLDDGAGWVLQVLQVLEGGARMRLIDLRIDASDEDEAQEVASKLVEAQA